MVDPMNKEHIKDHGTGTEDTLNVLHWKKKARLTNSMLLSILSTLCLVVTGGSNKQGHKTHQGLNILLNNDFQRYDKFNIV